MPDKLSEHMHSCILTAFFGALTWVLLATGGNTALQTDPLATAASGQSNARQWLQGGCEFTVGFGNDLIAHQWLQEKKVQGDIKPQILGLSGESSKLAFNHSCNFEPRSAI
jgi:hypothetical protein